MKTIVLYDSRFGNTQKIAEAIGKGIGNDTSVKKVSEVTPEEVSSLDVLVVGTPVHGGRASQDMQAFLKKMKSDSLKGVKVATFDTRFEKNKQGLGLKLVMAIAGYAAGRVASDLVKKGGEVAADPAGFIVTGKEGPLKEGEIERAEKWGKLVVKSLG